MRYAPRSNHGTRFRLDPMKVRLVDRLEDPKDLEILHVQELDRELRYDIRHISGSNIINAENLDYSAVEKFVRSHPIRSMAQRTYVAERYQSQREAVA